MHIWSKAGISFFVLLFGLAGALAETGIQPLLEIEKVWDIEDTHAEAVEPLISRMTMNGSVLGYDQESNTFYCTLGMENGDEWPELQFSVAGSEGLQVCWTDDYAYDSCKDAIAQGTRYDLIAWTDTEEQHVGIIFTGLPIVTLNMDELLLTREDLPGRITVSSYMTETIDVPVYAHKRGFSDHQKFSARIELHKDSEKGIGKKQRLSLLGMPEDSDWLLMGNAPDPNCVNAYMGWRIWSGFGDVITPLQTQFCEVFFNGHYYGVYQLMQRIDAEKEIKRIGGNKKTDIAGKMVKSDEPDGHPIRVLGDEQNDALEIRWLPKAVSEDNAFRVFEDAYHMLREEQPDLSDEAFSKKVLRTFDLENLLEEYIFEQVICHFDNMRVGNNTYLWAMMQEDRTYRILISPWDLDETVTPARYYASTGDSSQQFVYGISVAERTLNLNAGNSREILWRLWKEKREGILSRDSISQLVQSTYDILINSGACRRNLDRWSPNGTEPDTAEIKQYVMDHMDYINDVFTELWPLETEASSI